MDDWASQANVRQKIAAMLGTFPGDGNYGTLDEKKKAAMSATEKELYTFSREHLKDFSVQSMQVDFPWNRMFEADIEIK